MRRIRGNTGTRNIFFFQINQSTKVSSILRGNVGKLEKKCRNETPIQESTLIPFACFLQPPPLVASEDTSLFLTTETHPPTHPSTHPSVPISPSPSPTAIMFPLLDGYASLQQPATEGRQESTPVVPTHTPTPARGQEGVGACVHPRAGHGVTHFKKNRRAKKASIFSSPFFFLSLSLPLSPWQKRGAQQRREERRGEARLIRLSTYQVRSKWISREVSREMFFCFPFPALFLPPCCPSSASCPRNFVSTIRQGQGEGGGRLSGTRVFKRRKNRGSC